MIEPIVIEPAGLALLAPVWLLLVPIAIALAFRRRSTDGDDPWRRVFDPAALAFARQTLLHSAPERRGAGGHGRWRVREARWLAVALIALALADPAVRHDDTDAWLHAEGWIAVVDVSRSMTQDDVRPSRLAAARRALHRLAQTAGGRPLAMIVYAGDAFLAVPPAFDHDHFREHVSLLDASLIPIGGSTPARALSLAASVAIESELASTRIVLLTDGGGVDEAAREAARFLGAHAARLDVWQFGLDARGGRALVDDMTPAETLGSLARLGGGEAWRAGGIGALPPDTLSRGEALTLVPALRPLGWDSQAHWILLPLVPWWLGRIMRRVSERDDDLPAVGSRRRIATLGLCAAMTTAVPWSLGMPDDARADDLVTPSDDTSRSRRNDLAAHGLYLDERYLRAAELFADPEWRGVALYRSGQYWRAIEVLLPLDGARANYNLGNCYARLGYPALALEAYRRALAIRPTHEAARHNADLMKEWLIALREDREATASADDADAAFELAADDEVDEDAGARRSGTENGSDVEAGSEAAGDADGGRETPSEGGGTPPYGNEREPEPRDAARDASGGAISGREADAGTAARTGIADGAAPASPDAGRAGRRLRREREQATRQWLARIERQPERFLRQRIALEIARRRAAGEAPPVAGRDW